MPETPKRTRPPTIDEMRAEIAAERAEYEAAYRVAIRAAIREVFGSADAKYKAIRSRRKP